MADPARDKALSELVARVRGLTGPVGMTEAREIALFAREQAGLDVLPAFGRNPGPFHHIVIGARELLAVFPASGKANTLNPALPE